MAEEKSLEEQVKLKAQEVRKTARYMAGIDDLVEERIRKAREQGAFDNLEGAGKPLHLYENPFEPSDMRLAFKILKDAGYAPYWVELGKDVDAELAAFWEDVDKFKNYIRVVQGGRMSKMAQRRLAQKKSSFYEDMRLRLTKLNQMIDNYNIHNPMFWLGREKLDEEKEYARVVQEVEEIIIEVSRKSVDS